MSKRALLLLAGDLLILSAFIVAGLGTHAELAQASALQRYLLNAVPHALAWTLAAGALGAFRVAPVPPARAFLGRSLAAWLIAAPLALLLRAYLLGAATIVVIFFTITLLGGGGLLLAWRAVFYLIAARRGAQT